MCKHNLANKSSYLASNCVRPTMYTLVFWYLRFVSTIFPNIKKAMCVVCIQYISIWHFATISVHSVYYLFTVKKKTRHASATLNKQHCDRLSFPDRLMQVILATYLWETTLYFSTKKKYNKDEARRFSAGSKLRAVVVYGGTSIGHQASQVS